MPSLEVRWGRAWRRAQFAIALTVVSAGAMAHEPVARCVLLDPNTVRCRGATNDGDEMPGARMDVIAIDGETLLEGRLDDRSVLTFARPARPYYVFFDIGAGLQVTVEEAEIGAPPAGRAPGWMSRP